MEKILILKYKLNGRFMFKENLLLIAILFLNLFSAGAQTKLASRTIISEDGRQEVNYLIGENRISINDTLDYYWHYANEVKTTQGGYEGALLDGPYVKFDKDDNLQERGNFKKGLKNGDWIKWSVDGKILSNEKYKKGLRNGIQKVYVNGKLLERNQFRKGKRHGYSILYGDGLTTQKVKYVNGRIKVKKQKLKDSEKIPLKEKGADEPNGNGDQDDGEKLRKKAEREKKKAARKLKGEKKKKAKTRKSAKQKINKENSSKDRK